MEVDPPGRRHRPPVAVLVDVEQPHHRSVFLHPEDASPNEDHRHLHRGDALRDGDLPALFNGHGGTEQVMARAAAYVHRAIAEAPTPSGSQRHRLTPRAVRRRQKRRSPRGRRRTPRRRQARAPFAVPRLVRPLEIQPAQSESWSYWTRAHVGEETLKALAPRLAHRTTALRTLPREPFQASREPVCQRTSWPGNLPRARMILEPMLTRQASRRRRAVRVVSVRFRRGGCAAWTCRSRKHVHATTNRRVVSLLPRPNTAIVDEHAVALATARHRPTAVPVVPFRPGICRLTPRARRTPA